MKIQEIYARRAAAERGIEVVTYEQRHKSTPRTVINGHKFALVFPRSLIEPAPGTAKTVDLSFRGTLTPSRRQFLADVKRAYPNLSANFDASDYGRDNSKKMVQDEDYLRLLREAKFAVCPNGDFVWTYRFFEAVACRSIPVVQAPCPLYHGFYFYSLVPDCSVPDLLSPEAYRLDWVAHNLDMLSRHFMLP